MQLWITLDKVGEHPCPWLWDQKPEDAARGIYWNLQGANIFKLPRGTVDLAPGECRKVKNISVELEDK